MKQIVVVGSINLDLVAHCERVPNPGETILGTSFATHHGGKGANQAVAAARLGAPTVLIGCVGEDAFGQELYTGLRNSGVDVSAVSTQAGYSGVALIQVDAQQQNRITVVPGANAALTPERLASLETTIADAGMVLTQLETPLPTVEALGLLCEQHSVPLMLDPAPAAPLSRNLLRRVAWLTPNLSEACALLGRNEPASLDTNEAFAMAKDLLQLGPAAVLLKLGEAGLVAVQRDQEPFFQPAFRVQAVDTTAAGDACNAAFATAILGGSQSAQALRYAAAAGALSVMRHGAQPSLPTAEQVDALLNSTST